jgi:hypothetical protein
MKVLKVWLVLVLIVAAIELGFILGRNITPTDSTTACPNVTADIIQSAQGDVYKPDDTEYVEPKTYYLVTYLVQGDQIVSPKFNSVPNNLTSEQKDTKDQQKAWKLFAALIPQQDRQTVSEFVVFTDGESNTLAAVDYAKSDPTRWAIQVDIADLKDEHALAFTIVHEFAHLLTLNSSQVAFDADIAQHPDDQNLLNQKAALCNAYFTGTGCSLPDSYVNVFYNRFWTDINADWQKVDALQYEDDAAYYNGLYDFYLKHRGQFVDDYAVTHPTEDIAESFAYFIFSPKPAGNSIKEQKIKFFYEYPELAELRNQILGGACEEFK